MIFFKQLAKRILRYEAQLVLARYSPKTIVVSGSVGKTTTRDALYSALSKRFFVRKSEKSFTAELGIPLAILGCMQGSGSLIHWIKNIIMGLGLVIRRTSYPDYLLLEADCDKPGDLQGLAGWLSPNILVLTALGTVPSHIESFEDIDAFMREQSYIIQSLARDGIVVYNADDPAVCRLAEEWTGQRISCGVSADAMIKGTGFEILYGKDDGRSVPVGMSFAIAPDSHVTVFGTVGMHAVYSSLLAYGLAHTLGLPAKEIIASLNQYKTLPGRMHIVSGIKNSTIIDDSYNASPAAVQEAIHTLSNISCNGKKIAVIGDMLELGRFSADEHRKIATALQGVADRVITVGLRARRIAEELLSRGYDESCVVQTDTSREAGKILQDMLTENDIILVKGSQAMRMERVVEEVMRHPEDARRILVRQEPEWLARE